jgi:hypothetical protein
VPAVPELTLVIFQSLPLKDEYQPVRTRTGETNMRLMAMKRTLIVSTLLFTVLLCGCNAAKQAANNGIANWFEITINGVVYQSEDWTVITANFAATDSNVCAGEMSGFNLLPFGQPYSLNGWGLGNSLI